MAAELFVDTSAWYPAVVRPHPDHAEVAAAMEERVKRGVRVVTTNLVVAETHALLLHRAGRQAALAFAQAVRQPPILVVAATPDLEHEAINSWLVKFGDQDFSFADAVSFAVMKARKMREALTLDAHFGVAGFAMVPGRGKRR